MDDGHYVVFKTTLLDGTDGTPGHKDNLMYDFNVFYFVSYFKRIHLYDFITEGKYICRSVDIKCLISLILETSLWKMMMVKHIYFKTMS